MSIDSAVSLWLNGILVSHRALIGMWQFLASTLPWLFLPFLVLFVCLKEKISHIKIVLEALASALFSRFVITEIIHFFYSRPRPFESFPEIRQFTMRAGGDSLPSGHAAFFFGLAFSIFLYNKKWGTFLLALAVIMGVARIGVGVHYLSDIVSGALMGVLSAFLIQLVVKKKMQVQ